MPGNLRIARWGTMPRARRAFISLLIALSAMPMLAAPASAESPVLIAELEGQPIPATSAGDYYCHDFDYPVIHCFRTADALERSVEGLTAVVGADSATIAGTTAVSYVKIYDYASYAGNYAYISQDYSQLGDIGWNDRISSYIALNSETGAFYTNAGFGGTIDYFCCNQGVASLSSTFNNQISSVRRT